MGKLKREIDDIERFEEIASILVSNELGYILDRIGLGSHVPVISRYKSKREDEPSPERLRKTFEELGPTFVKFGQLLSERPDIVPERYVKELRKLQDDVEGFSSEEAKSIVDEEVGLSNFSEFRDEKIASASIAQVHKAKVGEEDVIVKIRRPGIKEQIEKDLDILGFIVKESEKVFGFLDAINAFQVFEEFKRWTLNECDLDKEMRNAQIFKENLKNQDNLYVPKVYPDLSSEKVLVMEYVEGIKCTDDKLEEVDVNSEQLAETAIKAGIKQIVVDGFFHADPHPSNFLIQEDGTMAYLDFGMMGNTPKDLREKIDLILIHSMKENSESILNILKDIGKVQDDANIDAIKKEIEKNVMVLNNGTLANASISEELLELIIVCGKNGIILPTSLTLMAKNLITMESIGLTVCPDYEPATTYEQYGKKVLKETNDPKDISEDIALDFVENKDIIRNPFTKLKQNLQQTPQTKVKLQQKRINLLPSVLVLSSVPLTIFGLMENQIALYLGIIQLLLGIYLFD